MNGAYQRVSSSSEARRLTNQSIPGMRVNIQLMHQGQKKWLGLAVQPADHRLALR